MSNYSNTIDNILNNIKEKQFYLGIAMEKGIYDTNSSDRYNVAEAYSRYKGYLYLSSIVKPELIEWTSLKDHSDFIINGYTKPLKVDVKRREQTHLYYNTYYVDLSKWVSNDYILFTFTDGYAALFNTHKAPYTIVTDVATPITSARKTDKKSYDTLASVEWKDALQLYENEEGRIVTLNKNNTQNLS